MSVVRYSSWVAVMRWGISPRKASSTSRLRSTVPGVGVLETRRWVIERVVGGQLWAGTTLQFFVRRLSNPLGASYRSHAAQVHPGSIT